MVLAGTDDVIRVISALCSLDLKTAHLNKKPAIQSLDVEFERHKHLPALGYGEGSVNLDAL